MATAICVLAGCAGATQNPTQSLAPTSASPATTASVPASLPPLKVVVPPDPHDGAVGLTVTVPSSLWRFDAVARGFARGQETHDVPDALLFTWTFAAGTEFWVYSDPCHWQSTRPAAPATSVDELVSGLAAQTSRTASNQTDVTVDGYAGKSVTLHVPDDAVFADCDMGDFTTYGVTGDEPTRYKQGPGQIDEFWVVDVDGATAVFDATYRADSPSEWVDEMRAIVASTMFDKP